ncbi:hypothetical protein [Accumulibacter sp.]|uniref:hypothetical protein n=1 Tax=Accumulibacter sp. TaxID=2053492 RepID=UPI00257A0FB8|nr:hypothetical protein [Accumulibacter sp.]
MPDTCRRRGCNGCVWQRYCAALVDAQTSQAAPESGSPGVRALVRCGPRCRSLISLAPNPMPPLSIGCSTLPKGQYGFCRIHQETCTAKPGVDGSRRPYWGLKHPLTLPPHRAKSMGCL